MFSKNTIPQSPKVAHFAKYKLKSSDTIFMSVMMMRAFNLEEELGSMKATLERLSKENVENDAKTEHQNKQIIDLTKKMGKGSPEASNKGSNNEKFDKESDSKEDSDENPKQRKTGH